MLCIGYSGSLATTAPLAAKLLETFHFAVLIQLTTQTPAQTVTIP